MTGKRHGFHAQWRVGFDDDGLLQALDATLTSDGGWSLDLSEPVLARALCHIDNAYWIPNVRVNGRIAKTNKTSQTAFRGFGGPQGMLVIEDILGRCAPLLGHRPADLRRRNFYREGQDHAVRPAGPAPRAARSASGTRCSTTGDVAARRRGDRGVQRRAPAHQARAGDHAGEVRHLLQLHRLQPGRRAGARLQGRLGADQPRRHRDGPGPAHQDAPGRGHRPSASRCRAVRLAPTRTDKVPNTSATAASSGADLNGGAVKNACEQIRERLAPVAATARRPPATCVRRRRCAARHGERAVGELVTGLLPAGPAVGGRLLPHRGAALGLHGDARARRSSTSPTAPPPPRSRSTASPAPTGPARVDIVHDVGDSLSPLVDLGQIEGGFVQGAGWLTLEDLRWDESRPARRGAGWPPRRRAPTSCRASPRCPRSSTSPCSSSAHEDGAVYGSKAVGEPPLMLAFSVREALRQAAAAFGPAGTSVDLASPATPEAVFWAVEEARGGARAAAHDADGRGRARRRAGPAGPTRRRRMQPALRAGRRSPRAGREPDVHWLAAVERLRRERRPACSSRSASVRGHAPREAGAKMVVAADDDVGHASAAATSRRPPSTAPARCSRTSRAARPSSSTLAPHRQGALPSTACSAAAAR